MYRWLSLQGSLTAKVRSVSECFSLRLLKEGWFLPFLDEYSALSEQRRSNVWTRDILLGDAPSGPFIPLVFAHSIVLDSDLSAWPYLRGLGNRPLGEVLFQHHGVKRSALQYRKIDRRHPLYRAAVAATQVNATTLWARRSVFSLCGASLLVTEVFLPEIFQR